MTSTDRKLEDLSQKLGNTLLGIGAKVACAESCTGGWISKVLTDVPGSSSWFGWGFVTYADEAKRGELDVPIEVLSEHGAVSEPVVAAMAQKALERSGAEYAVAVSGVAGPDGGTEDKPVGTVWFAWGGRQMISTECCHFAGNREFVRRQSVVRALEGLLAIVGEDA